jgi:hypothetical protein
MTDRFHSLTVVLEKDMRSDDAQGLMDAIQRMRGVVSVSGNVTDLVSHLAESRARFDLGNKIWRILHPETEV